MILNLSGPIITPKTGDPDSILVLLHGYGSDGHDLISLAPLFADLLPAPVIFAPNAPERCAMNPGGYQWFDLAMVPDFNRIEGIVPMAETIHELLDGLWRETGLGPSRTVLSGFSQGAILTLYAGLGLDEPLAGLISFSGGLPLDETSWPEIAVAPPILLVHGDTDPVVPVEMSVKTAERLNARGLDATLHISPECPHAIAPDGITMAREFVAAHFPPPTPQG